MSTSKYHLLMLHLSAQQATRIPTTFAAIELILGKSLPASARHYPAWWANDSTPGRHANAWLQVGYHTANLNLQAETLTFVRQTIVHQQSAQTKAASPRPTTFPTTTAAPPPAVSTSSSSLRAGQRIYLTHCSATKDDSFRHTGVATTPDRLYTSTKTQVFIHRCRERNVTWAIFSDEYGVWFPHVTHFWYEKDPNTVTQAEYCALLADFDRQISGYAQIWFYHNPGRFHRLYARLLRDTALHDRVHLFSNYREIH